VADQHRAAQVLPFDQIRDVLDVGGEIDLGRSEVASLARPVSVGANTSWPEARNDAMTSRQHQPPWNAPWTRTKVVMPNLDQLDWRR
jgi:hypothetical protein